jgi:nucleoside transporter
MRRRAMVRGRPPRHHLIPMQSAAPAVGTRLSVMMFLQFFIWGSWYVTVGNFIKANGWTDDDVGWAYQVGPIAAVLSPVFLGMVADRFFASERVLAAMHLIGGAIMLLLPGIASSGAEGASATFGWMLLGYMLCYMPTLGLSNTVAFHNITDQERQFPIVRVFGTLGWIAANVVVSKVLEADKLALQFQVAGGASILLGAFSLSLPHTPPPAKGQAVAVPDLLGLRAVGLMRDPSFLVFMLASFLICIPLAAYYAFAPIYVDATAFDNPGFTMSFGQWAEVVFMLLMPWFFARLGVKWMLAVGMLAWVVRYGLFAAAADEQIRWMVLGGILLHGICYDFFFVTGQIYVDKVAPRELRGQAQGFLVLMTQGLGLGLGAKLATELKKGFTTTAAGGTESVDWSRIWLYPALFAGIVLLVFVAVFRDRRPAA